MEFNDEQNYFNPSAQFEEKNPAFVQFLINLGLAKDAKSANIILLAIGIIFLVTSFFFFARVFGGPDADPNNQAPSSFSPDPTLLP